MIGRPHVAVGRRCARGEPDLWLLLTPARRTGEISSPSRHTSQANPIPFASHTAQSRSAGRRTHHASSPANGLPEAHAGALHRHCGGDAHWFRCIRAISNGNIRNAPEFFFHEYSKDICFEAKKSIIMDKYYLFWSQKIRDCGQILFILKPKKLMIM